MPNSSRTQSNLPQLTQLSPPATGFGPGGLPGAWQVNGGLPGRAPNEPSGLFAGPIAVPLLGVRVTGTLTGRHARYTLAQRFKNSGQLPLEAVYKFPLPEDAAVAGFSVRLSDGRTITGQVEEREAAFNRYDEALQEGHGAYLLDQERPNLFTLAVGNLPAGGEAEITLELVESIATVDTAVRFCLPTTIAPRYLPAGLDEPGEVPVSEQLHPVYAASVPYGLALELTVVAGAELAAISSPSHPIRQERRAGQVVVSFCSETVAMDQDFVLVTEAAARCRAFAETAPQGGFLAMDLALPVAEAVAGKGLCVEFLLDTSGSMEGSSLAGAKRALQVALKALPRGSRFNLTAYSTGHSKFQPAAVPYNGKNLAAALAWLEQVRANGVTNLYPALASIVTQPAGRGVRRSVLVITDGDIGNEAQVCALAARHRSESRIYTIGIGLGPNEYLVRQLARSAGGASLLITPGEQIEARTLSLFQQLTAPPVTELCVTAAGFALDNQAPATPLVFAGATGSLFVRLAGKKLPKQVTISWRCAGQTETETVPVLPGRGLAPLWAKAALRDLEEKLPVKGPGSRQPRRKPQPEPGPAPADPARAQLVALSTEFGVLCQATSFIAIEQRQGSDRTTEAAVLVKVPTLITKGFGGRPPANVYCCSALSAPPLLLGGSAGGFQVGLTDACYSSSRQENTNQRGLLTSLAAGRAAAPLATWCDSAPASSAAQSGSASGRRPRPVSGRAGRPAAGAAPLDLWQLLQCQQAGGGFDLSAQLRALLLPPAAWQALLAALPAPDRATVADTLVVLAWLEQQAAGLEQVWAGLVGKSRTWLAARRTAGLLVADTELEHWLAQALRS